MIALIILFCLSACVPLPLPERSESSSSSLYVAAGDILVSSIANDMIYQFDEHGNFKKILWTTPRTTDTINALSWKSTTNEIMVAVDGTPDRVIAISVIDGSERTLINDANLSGTIRGLAELKHSRSLIVSEGPLIERFNNLMLREVYTGVWPTNQVLNAQHILALDDGRWVAVSTGNQVGVKLFEDTTEAFVPVAHVEPIPGTAGAFGITQLVNGNFVVSWDGTNNDYISLYDSELNFIKHIIENNENVLTAPRGVAVKKNGNIIIADYTKAYLLEINLSGAIVKIIGAGILNSPYAVLIVPEFSN